MTLYSRTVIAFLFLLTLTAKGASAEILHLELGASNYYHLPESGSVDKRFAFLCQEVESLVKVYGREGKLYLNDLEFDTPERNANGLELVVSYMKNWLKQKGYDHIEVIALPGNYNEIEIPYVHTITLNNPDVDQLTDRFWDLKLSGPDKALDGLERIAGHSDTGLKINTYFIRENYPNSPRLMPDELIERHARTSKLVRTGRTGAPYYFPLDDKYVAKPSKVFYLVPECKKIW